MIQLNLYSHTLLQEIPDVVNIDGVGENVTVNVLLNNVTVYTTSLLSFGGVATLYDLRSIVEQHMRNQEQIMMLFKVTANSDGETMESEPVYVIFNSSHEFGGDGTRFYKRQFLTNRSFYVIPRNGIRTLALFDDGRTKLTIWAECAFLQDNEQRVLRINLQEIPMGRAGVHTITPHPAFISQKAEEMTGENCGKLLAYTIHAGERTLSFYVTDETSQVTFAFRNAFNALDYAFVFGTTNVKTEVERQEATCQGRMSFYNQLVRRKHEVTTVPLSYEEAHWLNELFVSPSVKVMDQQGEMIATALLGDISSEISNRPDEKVRMKFSWWYDDYSIWVDRGQDTSVFNNIYTNSFQ